MMTKPMSARMSWRSRKKLLSENRVLARTELELYTITRPIPTSIREISSTCMPAR